jgi:aminomethyltransferase
MTTAAATSATSPLAALHRSLGATFAPLPAVLGGAVAVARYGEVADEVRALREGCGLVDRWWVGALELSGADRQRFLNGLVTCDVKALEPGAGAYGFVTTVKGRVLAGLAVVARADRLLLELPPGRSEAIAAHLGKYKIADRVEIASPDAMPLTVAGPRAAEALAAAGVAAPPEAPWAAVEAEAAGIAVTVVRQGHLGVEGFSLWVAPEAAAELASALVERGASAGLRPVGLEAAEVVRVESGTPRWGLDFGEDHFPQETGLGEEAVSYTKGCYLGQEVVARIHYRGGVQRGLAGLRFDGAPEPPVGLLHDGRPAGTAGSVVRSAAGGAAIGLAILHQRSAAPGTVLEVEGGGGAEVVELPFS